MNSSTFSDSLTCQEDLFSTPAIRIQGILSILGLIGLLGLLLWPAYKFLKEHNEDYPDHLFEVLMFVAGIPGVLGAITGLIGLIGNIILAPIILAACGTEFDYTFTPSIIFVVTLSILFIGVIPSVATCAAGKRTACYVVLVTFAVVVALVFLTGCIAALFQWNQYNKAVVR